MLRTGGPDFLPVDDIAVIALAHGAPAAAVLLRDEPGQEAGLGQRLHELGRVGALAVERPPVLAGKFRAQRPHRLANLADRLAVGRRHTGSQLNTSVERSSG